MIATEPQGGSVHGQDIRLCPNNINSECVPTILIMLSSIEEVGHCACNECIEEPTTALIKSAQV